MFWVAASVCVSMIAVYAFTQSLGAWLVWIIGISLLVVVVCSGAIAWVEFRSNPSEDAERGEWTNKMLFYSLVFAITFFVGFLYWLSSSSQARVRGLVRRDRESRIRSKHGMYIGIEVLGNRPLGDRDGRDLPYLPCSANEPRDVRTGAGCPSAVEFETGPCGFL